MDDRYPGDKVEENIATAKAGILNGKVYTKDHVFKLAGLVSTAAPGGTYGSHKAVRYNLTEVTGKDIAAISQYITENEILVLPTSFLIKNHKKEGARISLKHALSTPLRTLK